jgi:hypothetical protein
VQAPVPPRTVAPTCDAAACRDDAVEPPEAIHYSLDETLTLLAALEDARDALVETRHLAVVVSAEDEIRVLSRKLGFRDPEGGSDGP